MDFKELCKKIISIESTPSTGNAKVAAFAADLCRQRGFDVHLQSAQFDGKEQFNLYARPQGSSKKNEVIFQTHLDTVEPGPMGNWTKTDHNPFAAHIEDEKIYGLGVADVKLDFLCKLFALEAFVKEKQKRPFVLVGTYAEELGMQGAQLLVNSKAVDAKMAIIGEPSELKIVYGNNGYLVMGFKINFSEEEKSYFKKMENEDHHTTQEKLFRGKAVHSSTPHLGENAIYKAISFLEKMPRGVGLLSFRGGSAVNTVPADANIEVDAGVVFKSAVSSKLLDFVKRLQKQETDFLTYDDKEFKPSHPTLNLGLIRTNSEGLSGQVSFRITPRITESQVRQWIKALEEFCTGKGVEITVERLSPPALTALDSELIKSAMEIAHKQGLPETPITKASGTESSIYRPHGIDCMVFGPGVSIGNSHTANEYNELPQLKKATDFYSECVKRFCL